MMTEITREQAGALAALIAQLRPEWDAAGVGANLATARARGTAWDLAHAALYAAEDPANRTPAVIPLAGAHWVRGRALGEGGPSDMPGRARCQLDGHEHERAHNCRICISDEKGAEPTARERALTAQHIPRDKIRAILAGSGEHPTDGPSLAAGENQ